MPDEPPEVPLRLRWLLYVGAWVAAFLSFFIPALLERRFPEREQVLLLLVFSWVFPSGLAAWFNHPKPLDDIGLIVLNWLAYLVLSFYLLSSRTRVRFYIHLLILAIILTLNVIGCHRIMSKNVRFG